MFFLVSKSREREKDERTHTYIIIDIDVSIRRDRFYSVYFFVLCEHLHFRFGNSF